MGKRITVDELLKRYEFEDITYKDAIDQINKYRIIRMKVVQKKGATRRKLNRYLKESFAKLWPKYFEGKVLRATLSPYDDNMIEVKNNSYDVCVFVLTNGCTLKDIFDNNIKLVKKYDMLYDCIPLTIGERCIEEV